MKIHFLDTVAPKPYGIDDEGAGGTEQTVIRVARALRDHGHEVEILASPKDSSEACSSKEDRHLRGRTIGLRDPSGSCDILWMHDYCVPNDITDDHRRRTEGKQIVCVSDFHKRNVGALLPNAKVTRIYNPVQAESPVQSPEKRRLIFLSNPQKGLAKTLQVMASLPGWHLYIARPSYSTAYNVQSKHIHSLGSLTHEKAMTQLAKSFALLQANDVFPETFGLVYAEANALGVPVLTYDLGAAKEILGPEQVMPLGTPPCQFAKRLQRWSDEGRPKVGPDPRFGIEHIAREWLHILNQ